MQFVQPVPDALLGIVADRAGVQQDEVGRFYIRSGGVIFVNKDRGYYLAVRKIHLASVGLNVGFLFTFQFVERRIRGLCFFKNAILQQNDSGFVDNKTHSTRNIAKRDIPFAVPGRERRTYYY